MPVKPVICFIDDSAFEHDLVRNQIAPCAPGLDFVQAVTFDEARALLGPRTPVLFLLDLWGQDPAVDEPYLTPRAELEERIARFRTLEEVYQGIEDFEGDRSNEYLKRLFTIVDSWRSLFETVCERIGQNRNYGLANLRRARADYPGVPAVFYTRKSLINDAVAMFRAEADGLFIKPTGKDDDDTRALTRQYAPRLLHGISLIVDRLLPRIRDAKSPDQRASGTDREDRAALLSAWKTFRNN